MDEMKKANVELAQKRSRASERNHLPGFDDEIFSLTGPIRCAGWDWDSWAGDAGSRR